jgi:hypothetical protein
MNVDILRQAIKDAFDPHLLFDYMEVTMDEFLDAFEGRWENNEDLLMALDIGDDRDVTEDFDELDEFIDTREVEDDGGYY